MRALQDRSIPFCVIGGQGLNAYVEPVVSLDLDVVVGAGRLPAVEALARELFHVEPFAHSLNISDPESDVRIQIQLDPRYADFVGRATVRSVLNLDLPVASVEDILQGKIWAAMDESRRGSKRQKDLADIARIVESYPHLRQSIPDDIQRRLIP